MDPNSLIPSPDVIPAPAWLLITLEQLLFLLHILLINALVGGSLIILFRRLFGKFGKDNKQHEILLKPAAAKLPILVALGVNMGVAPLLFMQVTFGHLFYTSSILMATYWIMIIPLLILGYYGMYIHLKKFSISPVFSKTTLLISSLILLYIGFMLVNNNSLMEQPENWTAYFANRGGTILNWENPALFPRYLHFIFASIAVGGLFLSIIFRYKKEVDNQEAQINNGLKIFAVATTIQVFIGVWYLLAIPSEFIKNFMGKDMFATIMLMAGLASGIASMVTGYLKKFNLTIILFLITMITMILTRFSLRLMYLSDNFQLSNLELSPQYGILALFLIVLIIGLIAIAYMLKAAFFKKEGRVNA